MIRNKEPTALQAGLIKRMKGLAEDLETELFRVAECSRERAFALMNLEQASMWITKAILEHSGIPTGHEWDGDMSGLPVDEHDYCQRCGQKYEAAWNKMCMPKEAST